MTEPSTKPRRRRLIFGLRGLMLAVLVVGGGIGWFVHRASDQRETVAAISRAHGSTVYNFTYYGLDDDSRPLPVRKRPPQWLWDALGPDYFGDVIQVSFSSDIGPTPSSLADDALMARFGRLHHLVALDLRDNPAVTGTGLARVRGLARLGDLQLAGTGVDGPSLVHLRGMTKLGDLSLPDDVSDADLAHIAGLVRIYTLTLNGPRITDAGLVHLAGLTNLGDLTINCPGVKGPGLAHIRGRERLDRLVLDRSGVESLDHLPPLPTLGKLSLAGRPIDDTDLARIPNYPYLAHLNLADTRVGDSGLPLLALRQGLEDLDLSGTRITDAGLAFLALLPQLQTIRLARTGITDIGLARFARLRSFRLVVEMIALREPRTLAAVLMQLGRGRSPRSYFVDRMETLDLSHSNITDAALPLLRSMDRLMNLDLEGTAITPAGLAAFKAGLPPRYEVNP